MEGKGGLMTSGARGSEFWERRTRKLIQLGSTRHLRGPTRWKTYELDWECWWLAKIGKSAKEHAEKSREEMIRWGEAHCQVHCSALPRAQDLDRGAARSMGNKDANRTS